LRPAQTKKFSRPPSHPIAEHSVTPVSPARKGSNKIVGSRSRPAWGNLDILLIKITKAKSWRQGSSGEGPEFKSQYCQKTKRNVSTRYLTLLCAVYASIFYSILFCVVFP
jgi:hypothetical protein